MGSVDAVVGIGAVGLKTDRLMALLFSDADAHHERAKAKMSDASVQSTREKAASNPDASTTILRKRSCRHAYACGGIEPGEHLAQRSSGEANR
ncbi:MAG: hypothetical protein ACLT98_01250 [Eggerthellaceae bacterium]